LDISHFLDTADVVDARMATSDSAICMYHTVHKTWILNAADAAADKTSAYEVVLLNDANCVIADFYLFICHDDSEHNT